jgi:hypothetical protein
LADDDIGEPRLVVNLRLGEALFDLANRRRQIEDDRPDFPIFVLLDERIAAHAVFSALLDLRKEDGFGLNRDTGRGFDIFFRLQNGTVVADREIERCDFRKRAA